MQNTTESTQVVTPETPASAPVEIPSPAQKNPASKKTLLILLGAVLAVALIATVAYLVIRSGRMEPETVVPAGVAPATPEEAAKPSYTLERDEETGERALFGSDETKNNSGEAFVEYQNAIANAEDSTQAEIFDAKILEAVYYIAIGLYDDAQNTLNSLDQSTFTSDQQTRFQNVSANLAEARAGQ